MKLLPHLSFYVMVYRGPHHLWCWMVFNRHKQLVSYMTGMGKGSYTDALDEAVNHINDWTPQKRLYLESEGYGK